jgi:outer membrane protein insertion porin family
MLMRLLAIYFLTVSLIAAMAQLSSTGPENFYNGEIVSSIDLIASPHRNLEPLYPLVVQKAGQPYSHASVDASIVALQKAGGFTRVKAQLVPEVSGLRLDLILEPPYYLGLVEFQGITKSFSYTRLLQVVNLQDEDPYDQTRLPISEAGLTHFLQSNGFFQAQVKAEPQIDDANQLVNVRFSVQLGKQARIGKVELHGATSEEEVWLLRKMRSLRARFTSALLKPGKPYSPERMKSATALLKKLLAKQHRLESKVHENPPQYNATTNRVDVSFQVDVGPVVLVRATGAKVSQVPFLSAWEMKRLIPIYSEGTIDPDLVQEGQQNLVNYFQNKGYFDAKVTADLEQQPDRVVLLYKIDRGSKHKIERISLIGNNQVPAKDLLPLVTVKRSHLWTRGGVSQKLLKQSADNLTAYYREKGYEDAKVTSQAADHDHKIDVGFNIVEGQQTLVDQIRITGNGNVPENQLAAPKGFQLKAGGPFSPRALSNDRNRIAASYLDRGYLNADVKTEVTRYPGNPHHVNVTYAITEDQLVRVSKVLYLGQNHTRLSLVEKSANLPSESPMRRDQLMAAQSRLYDLNMFDWSSVGPKKPITDQTEEDELVKVHEAKRNELTYGFGFEVSHRGGNVPTGTVAVPGGAPTIGLGSNQIAADQAIYASPLGSVELSRRNMRGLGETASGSILLSRLDQKAIISYLQPHFFGSSWNSVASVSIERTTENPLFAASLGDASFQLGRLLQRKTNTRLQLRYDFNKTNLAQLLVPELVLPQDRNIHLSTFSATLIRDTRDKPLDAHKGRLENLTLSISPSALGSSVNFAKLFGQYAFYKPLHSVVFANSIRLGLAEAFAGSFVPTSQLYFSGGGTTLRGFPIDEAGPQRVVPFCNVLKGQSGCVNITVPVGGTQLFVMNSEMRFPLHINKNLGGVIFYDGGNVYSAINFNSFVTNYTNTIGIGLRYSTPIGPVRIDLGHNVNPVPGVNPTQYFITLGQAF